MKKYEFNGKTKQFLGRTLHQIVCVTAFASVAVGDVGGWIEKESNLDHNGDAWVYGDARVYGNARVSGNARVCGDARVSGNARVYGNAWVYGDARVCGDARVYGNAWVYGDARVCGDARVLIGLHKVEKVCLLQIQGSAHAVNSPDYKLIKIGCQEHPPEYWLENFDQIGNSNGYTPEQIAEYKRYIDLFSVVIEEHKNANK